MRSRLMLFFVFAVTGCVVEDEDATFDTSTSSMDEAEVERVIWPPPPCDPIQRERAEQYCRDLDYRLTYVHSCRAVPGGRVIIPRRCAMECECMQGARIVRLPAF